MTRLDVKIKMELMEVGTTKVINDHVVTKKSPRLFDVARIYGKERLKIHEAAERITQ